MVNKGVESTIREMFRKEISKVCDDISALDMIEIMWPDGFDERLAEIITQSVVLMSESYEKILKES